MTRDAVAVVLLAIVAMGAARADAQIPLTAAPSGRAITEVVLTPASKDGQGAAAKPAVIRIDYGQPHLRGRQLHTNDLVPYDQPWRLGANASTTLTTEVDLVIGGSAVPRGKYVLRALPAKSGWRLLVERDAGQSPDPAPGDKPAEVVARVDLKMTTVPTPLESFTMWLIPSTAPGAPLGELRFGWGTELLSTQWSTK